jgi:hypothetical protein
VNQVAVRVRGMIILKAAKEITAEQAGYAENAEAERIRFEAVPSLAFAHSPNG